MCSKWFPPDSNSSDSYYCCPRGFDIINFFILWDFLQGQNIIVLSKSKDTDCIIIYIMCIWFLPQNEHAVGCRRIPLCRLKYYTFENVLSCIVTVT